jgi:hypothetical protein
MLFSYPLMVAIQQISARIGRTTGRGIAGNLRQRYPNWLLQLRANRALSDRTTAFLRITPKCAIGSRARTRTRKWQDNVSPHMKALSRSGRIQPTAPGRSPDWLTAALLTLALDYMALRRLGVTRRQVTGDAAAGWALIGDQAGLGLGRGNPQHLFHRGLAAGARLGAGSL